MLLSQIVDPMEFVRQDLHLSRTFSSMGAGDCACQAAAICAMSSTVWQGAQGICKVPEFRLYEHLPCAGRLRGLERLTPEDGAGIALAELGSCVAEVVLASLEAAGKLQDLLLTSNAFGFGNADSAHTPLMTVSPKFVVSPCMMHVLGVDRRCQEHPPRGCAFGSSNLLH